MARGSCLMRLRHWQLPARPAAAARRQRKPGDTRALSGLCRRVQPPAGELAAWQLHTAAAHPAGDQQTSCTHAESSPCTQLGSCTLRAAHAVKVAMESRNSRAAVAKSRVASAHSASYTLSRFLRSQSAALGAQVLGLPQQLAHRPPVPLGDLLPALALPPEAPRHKGAAGSQPGHTSHGSRAPGLPAGRAGLPAGWSSITTGKPRRSAGLCWPAMHAPSTGRLRAGRHLSMLRIMSVLAPTPAVFSSVDLYASLAAALSPGPRPQRQRRRCTPCGMFGRQPCGRP